MGALENIPFQKIYIVLVIEQLRVQIQVLNLKSFYFKKYKSYFKIISDNLNY
jgi:hypothetical protein